jgi:hypothetical protein
MSLSQIIQANQSACFQKHGVFFAFSNSQLNEQKQDGVEYVSLGAGTICPKANVKAFMLDHAAIVAEGIKHDIATNGKEAIIRRELANYECWYTGDIDDCVEALEDYGFELNDIINIFNQGE